MLSFDKKQQNYVKQLSFNKRNKLHKAKKKKKRLGREGSSFHLVTIGDVSSLGAAEDSLASHALK